MIMLATTYVVHIFGFELFPYIQQALLHIEHESEQWKAMSMNC
jgi:hypothetical protein